MASTAHFLGVDTGGTFTDFFYWSDTGARIHKVLSTPNSPERAIVQGIEELGLMPLVKKGALAIVHGSTVATNAALERKGVRTVFVTNKGFADMLTLGRQNREDIYALQPKPKSPPVARELCVEVDCRRNAGGQIVTELTETELEAAVEQIAALKPEAVAINLLFSYIEPQEEQRLAQALPKALFVSCSHEVLPEYKEYERGMATWLNAWLGPKVEQYINRLQSAVSPCPLGVMQSSGGTIDAAQASRRAVNLLLSGPAGGLAAAQYIGIQTESNQLLTFDMGGTSTDVALIDGEVKLTSEAFLGPYPVAVPMVDMHTIGAGGGSLAYLDAGGLLHVGPESSGAQPGPACYGLGGSQATVTDANAVLGRLRPSHFLGGRMSLDAAAAETAIAKLAQPLGVDNITAALGIIDLANEHMANALRVISVQKGYNPAEFELCCFGGAGGLHVCALAEALNMSKIIVPANGGVLSAFGMLVAPRSRQLSQSILQPLAQIDTAQISEIANRLFHEGEQQLQQEGGDTAPVSHQVSVDCRYQGQSFHINLPWSENKAVLESAFHAAHKHQFGHQMAIAIELVNIRVNVTLPALAAPKASSANEDSQAGEPIESIELPELGATQVWQREALAPEQSLKGPAIVCEQVATTLVAPNWQACCDQFGHLRLTKQNQQV